MGVLLCGADQQEHGRGAFRLTGGDRLRRVLGRSPTPCLHRGWWAARRSPWPRSWRRRQFPSGQPQSTLAPGGSCVRHPALRDRCREEISIASGSAVNGFRQSAETCPCRDQRRRNARSAGHSLGGIVSLLPWSSQSRLRSRPRRSSPGSAGEVCRSYVEKAAPAVEELEAGAADRPGGSQRLNIQARREFGVKACNQASLSAGAGTPPCLWHNVALTEGRPELGGLVL